MSFDQYYAELLTLAKSCEFGDLKDQLIKDKIVTGIPDNALRELLREKDLNLDKAVQMCRAAETTWAQAKELRREGTAVHAVKADGWPAKRFPRQRHTESHAEKKESSACKRCGVAHLPNKCPAFGKTCNNCGKKGAAETTYHEKVSAYTRKSQRNYLWTACSKKMMCWNCQKIQETMNG